MATFGWSYRSNASGSRRPSQQVRKVEEWQKTRDIPSKALHPQSHSAESLTAGKRDRRLKYDPRAKLYVGNLHWETTERKLAQYFSTFGEIETLKIIKDHETGTSRGFGFITFNDVDAASEAKKWCAYNHLTIDGRKINVKSAERHTPKFQDQGVKRRADSRKGPTLYWEYKWSEGDNAEVFGPFETSLMLEWSKAGYFASGCWVRQRDPRALSSVYVDNSDDEDNCEIKRFKTPVNYSDSSDSEDENAGSACPTTENIAVKDIAADDSSTKDIATEYSTVTDPATDDIATKDIATGDRTVTGTATDGTTTKDIATDGSTFKDIGPENITTKNVATCDSTTKDIAICNNTTKDIAVCNNTTKDIATDGITTKDIATDGNTTEDFAPDFIPSEGITASDIASEDTEFVHASEIDFAMFP